MNHPLLQNSHGTRPEVVQDDVFAEGIVSLDYAEESRTLLVGTSTGHVVLLNQAGEQLKRERGFDNLLSLVWSDTGTFGAAALAGGRLVCFDNNLKKHWEVKFTGDIRGLAITPFGSHIAVSSESSQTYIVSIDRKEISKFETPRPLDFLHFLNEKPLLIGAAEFGHLCCHQLGGDEEWNERIMNNVGNMAVPGCGKRILLAAFNHGIQVLSGSGKQKGSFMVDGIPNSVAASSTRKRLAATTLEDRIYWLNFEGELLWACDLSRDPAKHMRVDPLGERLFVATQSGRLLQLYW